jgi:hypothetical protein
MRHLTAAEARAFAEKWLPAWSGNNPELLVSFYSQDAFYLDPGTPQGVRGNRRYWPTSESSSHTTQTGSGRRLKEYLSRMVS